MLCYRWRTIIAWGLCGVLAMARCSGCRNLHGILSMPLQLLAGSG